jgi:hypothetical protein
MNENTNTSGLSANSLMVKLYWKTMMFYSFLQIKTEIYSRWFFLSSKPLIDYCLCKITESYKYIYGVEEYKKTLQIEKLSTNDEAIQEQHNKIDITSMLDNLLNNNDHETSGEQTINNIEENKNITEAENTEHQKSE